MQLRVHALIRREREKDYRDCSFVIDNLTRISIVCELLWYRDAIRVLRNSIKIQSRFARSPSRYDKVIYSSITMRAGYDTATKQLEEPRPRPFPNESRS
jgi:hypothetical protein